MRRYLVARSRASGGVAHDGPRCRDAIGERCASEDLHSGRGAVGMRTGTENTDGSAYRMHVASRRTGFGLLVLLAALIAALNPAFARRLDGFNIIATPDHPFGSPSAARALSHARRLGAAAIAVIPFLWQSSPSASDLVAGS